MVKLIHSFPIINRDRITLAVLELSENEELAKLEKTWWYEKSKCPQDSSILKKVDWFTNL